jgi:hypothetical protein
MDDQHITIRLASAVDVYIIRRLAGLDSSPVPTGRVLLAEMDGVPAAAMSLERGSVVADPFQHTNEAVRMLRARRYQLMRQGGDVAPGYALIRRLVARAS